MNDTRLPIVRSLSPAYKLSFVVALLETAVSLAGLLFSSKLYPTNELRQTFIANDVVNLFIGLPILLGSMAMARRGRLAGQLLWPGALLYILYNTIGYLVGVPLGLISFAYLALILLGVIIVYELWRGANGKVIQARLTGAVSEKVAGWVLTLFGILFAFRAIVVIAEAASNQTTLPASEIGVLIADLILSILWIVGGVWILQRKPLGYVSGLGLLFAACMLFVGLIMFLLLQPVFTELPFKPVDVIVVLIMSLICFVPFGLFLRGVLSNQVN